jgi:VanZ family protein
LTIVSSIERLPRWARDVVPLFFWMGLIFFLSDQPRLLEIESELNEKTFYKLAHVLAYAILAWLWWRALNSDRQVTWRVLGLAFTLATLYGISDEVHQLFIPGRHGRLADVLFDTAGALAMVLWLRLYEWPRLFPEHFSLPGNQPGRYT